MSPKPPLIVIAGPTGVGKTSLSLNLAESIDGEIVNGDSRSFYRGMDIGTAKPGAVELDRIPHHLIDIIDPADDMSLSLFQKLAFDAIDDIASRGKVPLLVGGTAQYLNSVVENWQIPQVPPDDQFRRKMEARVGREGVQALLAELREVDPESADRTGVNPRRVIRALEIYRATGIPMSAQQGKRAPRYRTLQFELWLPRDLLHERIARRIEEQIERELFAEVQALLEAGVDPSLPSFSSIGYREVLPYLRGEATAEETAAAIRHASNRLVRHQQTWFRNNPEMIQIDMSDQSAPATVSKVVSEFLSASCE